jgi:hypothetical protein
MNKFLIGFVSAILLIVSVSCSSILNKNGGVLGKSQKTINQARTAIQAADTELAKKDKDRLSHIGAYADATEYSLNKITNAPREVTVAKEINDRVKALADKPDFNEVKELHAIVDSLCAQIDKVRQDGEKDLLKKDKQLSELNNDIKELKAEKSQAINEFKVAAEEASQKADQYQATLKQMDSFFGLGAVFYGLKKFIISSLWIIGIGSLLFLILRVLSASNPIAAGIFNIFNLIGSWFVHAIQIIVPKAVSMAGNVATTTFNAYKGTMTKLVDAIQMAKEKATAAGKTATIEEMLTEASKSMNEDEKAIIDELKAALNWK